MSVYTFFDVETPNRHNDRICSIGTITTDHSGNVLEKSYYLVNPETGFDDVNMRIHGITPVEVRRSKTFPELWENELASLFPVDGVVAHNARFDLCVLTKTLRAYNMPDPQLEYACTLDMVRGVPSIQSKKLPDVCSALGFSMSSHHQADSDADACRRVFWTLVERSGSLPSFAHYRLGETARSQNSAPRNFSDKTIAMQWLLRMMNETLSDGLVSFDEAAFLLNFLTMHDELACDPSISPVVSRLQEAVIDGWIDPAESRDLMYVLKHIVDPAGSESGEIIFTNMKFVLTGSFDHGSKDSIAEFIASKGGEVIASVTKKCNYVVIGGCGSENYSLGSYGGKVKKALDWQAKGVPVKVIKECELFGEQ